MSGNETMVVVTVLVATVAAVLVLVFRKKWVAPRAGRVRDAEGDPSTESRGGPDAGSEDPAADNSLLSPSVSGQASDPIRLAATNAGAYRIDLDGISADDMRSVSGYTSEQLRALMVDQRREQPVLTAELDALGAQLGVTVAALGTFFNILEQRVPTAQWLARLSEIALRHQQALERLAALETEDPQVRTWLNQTRIAIQGGDYDEAEGLLDQAEQRVLADIRAMEERPQEEPAAVAQHRHSAAAIRAEQAEVFLIRLRYREAAERFAAAAELIPDTEPDIRATYRNQYAGTLYRQGDEQNDNQALEAAIRTYRDLLAVYTREDTPLDWAMAWNNLGNALSILGEHSAGTEHLEQAVTAYRAALQEYTRDRMPRRWATTQNNLGAALGTLGGRESDLERLEEAVTAYRAALQEYTRERTPLDWARTQNNLGNVLWTLGEQASTERLEEAVAAYRAALQEYTRERAPYDWAGTWNNLGTALQTLGTQEAGSERLEEAVAACRNALQEYTRERMPLEWARTQHNLGNALQTLGKRELGTARLGEAVAAYRNALRERTRKRVPLDWARTQHNLGNALQTLGTRESGTERLGEAVTAYQAALQERTRAQVPLQWATTQNNLGNTLGILGARGVGTNRLEAARAYIEQAWQVVKDAGMDQHDEDFRHRLEAIDQLIKACRGGKS